ncbi:glutathione binding-like protein [Novosphingobium sp. ZW T3_23]|uniref:glutathione binding-like protein n=1 Tax=Novosphingobium sp. ZW T3_23 TaxID=3378084 RepID=UPI003852BF26
MIDLYYWTTPNGHKVSIFLEEVGLPYRVTPVDIGKGEQFLPYFLTIAPNNRIPAIVDDEPADGGHPLAVFESGAILLYLAEKTGQFLPSEPRQRSEALQWLFWQVGGLGPMAGQNHHFRNLASEELPYAVERYTRETSRLFRVLDKRLADRRYLAGETFSIADIASYPWVLPWQRLGQTLEDLVNVRRWLEEISQRPAVAKAYDLVAEINADPAPWLSDRSLISVGGR